MTTPTSSLAPSPVDGVRPFPFPSLLRQVNEVLGQVPRDVPVAVIAAADKQQAGLYAFVRLGKNLSFMGRIDKPYDQELGYGVQISWFPGRK